MTGMCRGAQTLELLLHTPDILAACALVRAFTLGYQLSGDGKFLGSAELWANAGLAFVYLRDPTDGGIGPYATIAVFGATNRKAPNWMGQPVQWCGLVYADAIYRMVPFMLAKQDRDQWMKIADGITASGIQQTWPLGSDLERQGLLPDSFRLLAAARGCVHQSGDVAGGGGAVLSPAAGVFVLCDQGFVRARAGGNHQDRRGERVGCG